MSRPTTQLLWMVVGLIAAGGVVFLLWDRIVASFLHNPALNSGILVVLLVGTIFVFYQVARLTTDINWIENFQRGGNPGSFAQPRLLAPLAAMVKDKQHSRLSLSATTLRSVLDGIQARLDEHREISRYLITLLILLGLLGTFWGLLGTINAVTAAITGLDLTGSDPAALFDDLKKSLQGPLAGMGTAFSASLFGLSGSLLLGYLDLQAGQAHSRFFGEVEDWLSGQTKLGSGGAMVEGDQPVPAYIQALLEQTAESLDNLQRTISRTEADRLAASNNFKVLADHMIALTDQLRAQQQVVQRLMETQTDMRSVIGKLADVAQHGGFGIDPNSRTHLRNIDALLARMADDIAAGRHNAVQELRSEIKLLTRTIAVAAGMEQQRSS
ncbi:MAG TPA: flagellar motor protein MotA [Dongiaceae bacterium]|nr:flagellar motor protein MotA [Dongiaceae bacterium]